jgi:hypothetical protein
MRAPTGIVLAKVGEFRTQLSVFLIAAGICVATAFAQDYMSLVILSAGLGATAAASLVSLYASKLSPRPTKLSYTPSTHVHAHACALTYTHPYPNAAMLSRPW